MYPPLVAEIVTANATLDIVTEPVHWPLDRVTEAGLIDPAPVVEVMVAVPLYPVAVLP